MSVRWRFGKALLIACLSCVAIIISLCLAWFFFAFDIAFINSSDVYIAKLIAWFLWLAISILIFGFEAPKKSSE